MDKLDIIHNLLRQLDMPPKQQSRICILTLLAMANLKKDTPWSHATNEWIRVHDIIKFIADNYGVIYAENSRETFRKQALHPFRTAALIEDNGMATNSPNYRYRLTAEFLEVLHDITGNITPDSATEALHRFRNNHLTLAMLYASKKEMRKMKVRINQQDFTFSSGKHNQLQKAIIEEFAPRFAPDSICLYVGDTVKKDMVKDDIRLAQLGFEISIHDKIPDVILYVEKQNWIYFIEAVTSVGPMDPKRIIEIESMIQNVTAGRIYVTAFPDFNTYKKFSAQLAWETEVWIAEMPDHMIHLNGNKFLGPR